MKKAERERAVNNLIDYVRLRYTAQNRPGGKYMNRQEQRMTNKLKAIFNKQLKWLVPKIAELEPFVSTPDEGVKMIKTKTLESSITDVLEEMPYNGEVVEAMTFYTSASMVKGANYRIAKMKMGDVVSTFNLQTPEVTAEIRKMADLQLSNYKGAIQRTTKKEIKRIVIKGGQEGMSASAISKSIQAQGKAGVFSKARGEFIATREINASFGKGQRTSVDKYVQETGAKVEKRWSSVGDKNVREDHLLNEADGWIDLNEVHSGTNESEAPSDDFGCRCVEDYKTV